MTFSIPIPIPIPFPNGAVGVGSATELNHRGTEMQSHRTEKPQIAQINADPRTCPVASAKPQSREGVTKPSHVQLSGRRKVWTPLKNDPPHQEMISVFLCVPLSLCGEKPTNSPEIGALQ
jgi:hypothetical protein